MSDDKIFDEALIVINRAYDKLQDKESADSGYAILEKYHETKEIKTLKEFTWAFTYKTIEIFLTELTATHGTIHESMDGSRRIVIVLKNAFLTVIPYIKSMLKENQITLLREIFNELKATEISPDMRAVDFNGKVYFSVSKTWNILVVNKILIDVVKEILETADDKDDEYTPRLSEEEILSFRVVEG